jgi:hypothetical protein
MASPKRIYFKKFPLSDKMKKKEEKFYSKLVMLDIYKHLGVMMILFS